MVGARIARPRILIKSVDSDQFRFILGQCGHGIGVQGLSLLAHMIETGLSSAERQQGIYFAESLADIRRILNI